MNVFIRASAKLRISGSHERKSSCRLENGRAYICAACISTPNCICLTLFDVVSFNNITSTLCSYEYEKYNFYWCKNFKKFVSLIYGGLSSCKL